jgi:hypothetical protein
MQVPPLQPSPQRWQRVMALTWPCEMTQHRSGVVGSGVACVTLQPQPWPLPLPPARYHQKVRARAAIAAQMPVPADPPHEPAEQETVSEC